MPAACLSGPSPAAAISRKFEFDPLPVGFAREAVNVHDTYYICSTCGCDVLPDITNATSDAAAGIGESGRPTFTCRNAINCLGIHIHDPHNPRTPWTLIPAIVASVFLLLWNRMHDRLYI